MTVKFRIAAGALALLVYASFVVWQVDSARFRAGENFLEQQLWLARQSARFIETQAHELQLSAQQAVERLTLSELRIAESRVALFARDSGQFVEQAGLPNDATLALSRDAALLQRLAHGGHGSLRSTATGESWLVTYLPLGGDHGGWTLVLAAPQQPIIAPVAYLAAWQMLSQLAVLALIAAGLLWRRRKSTLTLEANVQDGTDGSEEQISELQNECRALAQENALLGAARREYQFLVEGADYGLARLNSNGLILFCSRPFLDITGRERKELLGRNLLDLDLFGCATGQLQRALASLRQGRIPEPLRCMIKRDLPYTTTVTLRLSPLRVEGETTGFLLQVHPQQSTQTHLRASLS